jgi:PAS domain S-box-containing protein
VTAALRERGVSADLPAEVRERALRAVGLSLTVSDARAHDHPLVWVNPGFERITGYAPAEALGRNCRFLQGPGTDPAAVARLHAGIAERRDVSATLLNHRADGTPFWNEVTVSPVHDADGTVTHFVGMQADVTARVTAEQRLALLAEATTLLTATLDVEEALDRLMALLVPRLADWCFVELLDEDGALRRVGATHADPARRALVSRMGELRIASAAAAAPSRQVLRSGSPVLLEEVSDELLRSATDDPELLAIYRELGVGSAMIVPLPSGRTVLGALSLVSRPGGRRYTRDDLATATDLARRAALAVETARLYTREHETAEQLQRSMLPRLAPVPGLATAARYLPGGATARIGGDWYDLFALPDGAIGLAIGDVMGHDMPAAAAMGQLRSVLRSFAWRGASPAQVLDSMDELVQGLEMAQLATALYARLEFHEPQAAGRRAGDAPPERPGRRLDVPVLRYANAGHLPPLLREPGGTVSYVEDGRSLLLGAPPAGPRIEGTRALAPGSVLVLYTDGLVEQRGRSLDASLDLLADLVRDGPDDVERLCDDVAAALASSEGDDDIALLAVRLDEPPPLPAES